MKNPFRTLGLRSYYRPGVESVLSGEMQARFMYNKRRTDEPDFHPNYYLVDMFGHPFEDPHQSRRMIRGAFTLRAIGVKGIDAQALSELAASDEPVPDLIGMDREPVSFSSLGVGSAVLDLASQDMITSAEYIVPSLDMAQVLGDNPIQPTTVIMFDKIPTLEKAQEINRIYDSL